MTALAIALSLLAGAVLTYTAYALGHRAGVLFACAAIRARLPEITNAPR